MTHAPENWWSDCWLAAASAGASRTAKTRSEATAPLMARMTSSVAVCSAPFNSIRCVRPSFIALVLFASTVWALWEVGLDWWQLVPRLALWFALGVVMLLPWFRRPLLINGPAPMGTGALSVAVVLAGATAVASQFTHPGETFGELGRDTADMTSTAPQMPEGDWQAYGRSEFGDRYSPLKQITPANVGKLQEAWRIQTGDLPTADDPVELTNRKHPTQGQRHALCLHRP